MKCVIDKIKEPNALEKHLLGLACAHEGTEMDEHGMRSLHETLIDAMEEFLYHHRTAKTARVELSRDGKTITVGKRGVAIRLI